MPFSLEISYNTPKPDTPRSVWRRWMPHWKGRVHGRRCRRLNVTVEARKDANAWRHRHPAASKSVIPVERTGPRPAYFGHERAATMCPVRANEIDSENTIPLSCWQPIRENSGFFRVQFVYTMNISIMRRRCL